METSIRGSYRTLSPPLGQEGPLFTMDVLAEYSSRCFDPQRLSRMMGCAQLIHTQLQTGAFNGTVLTSKHHDIQMTRVHYGSRLLLQGPLSSDRVALMFLQDGHDVACINGVQTRPLDVVVWPERVACDAFLPSGCVYTLIFFPRKHLLLAGIPARAFNRLQVLSGDGGRHQRLREMGRDSTELDWLDMDVWRDVLNPDAMVTRAPHCLEVQSTLRLLQTEVQSDLLKPWRVADLADISSVSRRRLELMCRQYLDVSPRQWVSALRLNEVRKRLLEAKPKQTEVGEVAQQCGFTHMGRFAQAYRHMFDEYPSETLRLGCDQS